MHIGNAAIAAVIIGVAVLPAAPPAIPVAPRGMADGVQLAWVDSKAASSKARNYRYLYMPDWPVERRQRLRQTVDWVVNSLSRRRIITRTGVLPNDQDPLVLKVDLLAYGIDPKAWDNLFEQGSGDVPLSESYFYIQGEKTETYHYEGDSKYAAGNYTRKRKTILPGPLAFGKDTKSYKGTSQAPGLHDLTGALAPIGRADWFAVYAGWAPAYYRLIGVKDDTEKELYQLFKVDLQLARDSMVAAVANSGIVALHNRILIRVPTVNGYLSGYAWYSFDTEKGIDDEDYMNNLHRFDSPSFAASEIILSNLNGLQSYGISNNKGKLINLAAAGIARHGNDIPTKLRDVQVYAGLRNCAFCHYGMQPINCQVRALAKGGTELGTTVKDEYRTEKLISKIQDAFAPDINTFTAHDSAAYVIAVRACNGLDAKQNARQYEDACFTYLEEGVTPEIAALEAGMTVDDLLALIRGSVGIDYTLVSLAQRPSVPVARKAWERRGFPQLMLIRSGLKAN